MQSCRSKSIFRPTDYLLSDFSGQLAERQISLIFTQLLKSTYRQLKNATRLFSAKNIYIRYHCTNHMVFL